MIILLLLGVSVSLKGFKDEYLSLVSMTLIGDAEFGVSNLFTQFFFFEQVLVALRLYERIAKG